MALEKYLRRPAQRQAEPPKRSAEQAIAALQRRLMLHNLRTIRPTQDEAILRDFYDYGRGDQR